MSEAVNFIYHDDCDCEKRTFLNVVQTENTDDFFEELAKQFLAIIEKLGLGIWKGQKISPKALENLTQKILSEITVKGFGKPAMKYNDPDFQLLKKLKEDVFVFSKAKTKVQLEEIRSLLTDGDKRIPFAKFKEKVLQIHEKYNVNWLRAEYNHAQNTAKTASKFADIARNKDKFDIKYVAVMDDRTRTEHRKLHGVILPVDDVFWRKYLPPLGWNCRCTFIKALKGTTGKPLPKKLPFDDLPPKEKARLEMFTFNPAVDGIIFPSKHPYYKVSNN